MKFVPATWSRPGEDHKTTAIAGSYAVDETGRPLAQLHGKWGDHDFKFTAHDDLPPVLHGDAFGESVTLVSPRIRSSAVGIHAMQDTLLSGAYSVEGFWLTGDYLALTDAVVRFVDQDLWTGWDAFVGYKPKDFVGWWPEKFELRPPETQLAEFEWGTIELADESVARRLTDANGWTLKSTSKFMFHFNQPVPILDVLNDYLAPIEFLISSATGRWSGIESLGGTNTNWKLDAGFSVRKWVQIKVARPEAQRSWPQPDELLHRAPDFDFSMQLPLVYEVANQARYSLEHFTSLLGDSSGGPLAEFVAACQLVESLDQALQPAKQRTFVTCLKRLDEESGQILTDIVGSKKWRDDVRVLRNLVVHGFAGADALTRDLRAVQVAKEMLLLLFEARLLAAYGFTVERVKELIEARAKHWQIKYLITENYSHVTSLVASTRDKPLAGEG